MEEHWMESKTAAMFEENKCNVWCISYQVEYELSGAVAHSLKSIIPKDEAENSNKKWDLK